MQQPKMSGGNCGGCGSECVLVTHEGEESELCPKCDEKLIAYIESGDKTPLLQVFDDGDDA